MHNTTLLKNTHNNQYGGYLLAIASISLLLFAVTSGTFAVPFTSNEQISHTSNESSAAGSGGLAAGPGVNVTASRVGDAVFDAAEDVKGAGNYDTTRAGFSRIGGAKSGSQEHEPAWQEPDAEDGSDGAGEGGMAPPGVYMVEAEPATPYIFSARGISSDLNGTYEPLVTAMEVDGSGRKIVEHNLSFSGCYDWVEKEITFTTSPNVSEFYVSMNIWDCGGTFRIEDVALGVYETPLPGISDLAHTAGRTWINWTWTNPADVRFAYVTVYLNGTYMGFTPDPFYNVTKLDSGAWYGVGVRTVDVGGNVSETEVNQTAGTTADGDGELSVRASDGLEFSLAESGAVSGVSIDGSEISLLSVPGGFSFRELYSTTSENLIANPGFETVSGDVPLNWALVDGAGTVVYDASEGHDSPGSIKVDIPGTADMRSGYPKSDLIDAKPGTMYTFSAWGKSSGVDGKYAPAVRVVELGSDGGWITQHSMAFDRDSDWEEKKTSFTTSSEVSTLYVYANIWESYGTFWIDDVTLEMCETRKISLESTVKNYDGSITQYATSSDITFRFDYIPRDRYIEVHGDIQDLRGVDRAIQVQYVLPVDATGWQWGDYIRESREIGSGVRYENVYNIGEVRTQNTYPFTFVGEDEQGLSLAVPMDVPRIYRVGYDTGSGGYSIEHDFGLANCTDKIGAGHANFTFIVYKVDEPEWGFRAVAKKYYELYPEFFVKGNDREGLWIIGNQMDLPNVSDFGFAFTDSHSMSPSERIFNAAHSIYTMRYSEPWGYRSYFGDNSTEPSYEEKIARLNEEIINGTDLYECLITRSEMASSVFDTCPLDKNGNQHLSPYLWEELSEWTQSYPMNPDPDLPGLDRFEVSYLEYSIDSESSSSLYVHNWTALTGNWSIVDDISHTSSHSAELNISGTGDIISKNLFSDSIDVLPSTQYNFSAWARTYQCGGSSYPAVRAVEYTADGAWITQHNLHYEHGTNDWVQENTIFTTASTTATIKIYSNLYGGYGTFWVDDVNLSTVGSDINLIQNAGFESTDSSQCDGLRLDSLLSHGKWARLENYRRSQWAYTDHPLVFSYDTKQPVLLGTLSHYEYIAAMHANMSSMGKRVDANIFSYGYSFYGHLIDVLGNEVWYLQMDDDDASLHRTMSYQKTNRNLLVWDRHGDDPITHEEVETYMNDQMFHGMFPGIWYASGKQDDYWGNATLYERDRDLFKKYVPLIREISSAGWDPVPYATADNHNIKLERYGQIEDGLYYTVGNSGYTTESGVLSVDLSKFGFGGTAVEVKELVTDITSTQDVADGKVLVTILELRPDDTRVYRINP